MKIKRVTPILIVDAIEPVLPFWKERMGYQQLVEVPHEGKVGFVLLSRDDGQVMLQTRASLHDDLPKIAAAKPTSVLYVDVDSIEKAQKAMKGLEVIVERRKTFYGAHEFAVKDPSGQITIFSQHDRE